VGKCELLRKSLRANHAKKIPLLLVKPPVAVAVAVVVVVVVVVGSGKVWDSVK
jgi:hypothetical protein